MQKNLIDAIEMAKILGVSRVSLYSWASQELIPVIRVGKLLRFDPDEVVKYFQEGKYEKAKKDQMDAFLNRTRK